MNNKTLKAVVLGYGDRGSVYSGYSLINKHLEIVAVVDPNDIRRNTAKNLFGLKENNCFANFDDFIHHDKMADFVINTTMDNLHIKLSIPVLKKGYHLLLEKPITNNKKDLLQLLKVAEENNRRVFVCHVLRFAPFYKKIKEVLDSGVIGKIRHIESTENVGISHASCSFIRGKWNNSEKCGSTYLLAKCCHDIDLLCWYNSSSRPNKVLSMGNRRYFIPENAPKDSGNRCLVDCKYVDSCIYSCKEMLLKNDPIPFITWRCIDKKPEDITMEERIQSLKTNNPHGKCIFKTDANLVDQQVTCIEFENGVTATHTLYSGAAHPGRRLKIYGEKGDVEGYADNWEFNLTTYRPSDLQFDVKKIVIPRDEIQDPHYGGDYRLLQDVMDVLDGKEPSKSTTTLKDSVYSHLCVYAADESMKEERAVKIEKL